MLPFKKCDNCTGSVCICNQNNSDKNRIWCDRSDLEIENDRLRAENARYLEALEDLLKDEWDYNKFGVHHWDRAREALKGGVMELCEHNSHPDFCQLCFKHDYACIHIPCTCEVEKNDPVIKRDIEKD